MSTEKTTDLKQKNIGDRIMVVVFVAVICLAWFWWLLFGRVADTTNHENRNLAKMPHLSPESYTSFSKDFEAFFDDRIPFRNELIKINDEIDYEVFKSSPSRSVVIGRDNWLFFSTGDDIDPLLSYQGEDLFSDEELEVIAENCMRQRDLLRDQGMEFILFIAVNKEHIYPEYMPIHYGFGSDWFGALQIYDYLKKNTDIRVVFPYKELLDAKEKLAENIYYKADTHWNYIGGYVAAGALLKELGIDMPPVYSDDITIIHNNPTAGDLAEMLDMESHFMKTDTEYYVEGYDKHNVQEEWDFFTASYYHATGADPRRIYVIRDSFSTHLAPYIGSQFDESCLTHLSAYRYDDLKDFDPDIVIYELAERYCRNLIDFTIVPE